MKDFYERIIKIKDDVMLSNASDRDDKINILSQLMVAAFKNSSSKDELPPVFQIQDTNIKNGDSLKELLNEFGIHVRRIKPTAISLIRGYSYEIEQELEE